MADRDSKELDEVLAKSQELLREIDASSLGGAQLPAAPSAVAAAKDAHPEKLGLLETLAGPVVDECIEVTVSEDAMVARARFLPPSPELGPLDLDAVRQVLEARGIATGVDWEAIKEAVLRCNTERAPVSDTIIARGIKPQDEVPPTLALVEGLRERGDRGGQNDSRMDFRELSPFVLVKSGEVLAELTPKREGVMGSTVRGTAVAYRKTSASSLTAGKNTRWDGERVVASCDGILRTGEGAFWVDEVLQVPGDVDYSVGNIDFPGDVVIPGEIRDGFKVSAGGSLFCFKSIDASQIQCGGDLHTNQGVIGRKQAIIKVGGSLRARFIENCYVEAQGPIVVQTSVMNSSLNTLDRLEMGERGIVVGGVVTARNGVTAAQIGSSRASRTEIRCGIDFSAEQKLGRIREQSFALASRLRGIEQKLKAAAGDTRQLESLAERIRATIGQLNETARALVAGVACNEKADVSVRGVVFPGTSIEICRASMQVSRQLSYVTFRLDPKEGRIVAHPFAKRSGSLGGPQQRAAPHGRNEHSLRR